jgi:hypothetical protein
LRGRAAEAQALGAFRNENRSLIADDAFAMQVNIAAQGGQRSIVAPCTYPI